MAMSMLSLVWVGYVGLMQSEFGVRLGLLNRSNWDVLYPIAWIPCAITAVLVTVGLRDRQKRHIWSVVSLAIAGIAFSWWYLVPYMWR